jgi:hypothetical protein
MTFPQISQLPETPTDRQLKAIAAKGKSKQSEDKRIQTRRKSET